MKKIVRRSGFTLPEILVTVTVVAVLAAVVVPAVTQFASKGDAPASVQDIGQLRNAVTGFTADVRKLPARLTELTTMITSSDSSTSVSGNTAYTASDSGAWKGPYLSATVSAASGFTSSGLGLTISDTLSVSSNWLAGAINSITSCPALLRLDTLIDKGDGGASGTIAWTGACAQGAPTGATTGAALRLTQTGS